MASSVSSNGGSNNVMIRSKSDSIGVAGGHTATAMDERNTQGIGGGVGGGNTTATLIGGLATGPERRVTTTADDSAISFSEEEEEEDEDEMDGEGDDDEEEDDHRPESSEANAAAAAAAFNAAAAAAFQRQLLANFPLFHHASDGSSKLDNDPSNASAAMEAMSSTNNSPNPFESYIAAAAAAAAAANAEALFRQHQQQLAMSGSGSHAARLSEKRTAHDSGTDDNDLSLGGGKGTDGSGSGKSPAGIHQQPPSNKRRKQSKPVRISSDQEPGANDENATSAVTAFLAAQTAAAAAAAALFHQNNPNASSEEEEEGVLLQPNSSSAKLLNGQHQQQMLEWVRANNHMMTGGGSHESEQEEGQIIRSSSANSSGGGHMFDHQLASRLMMAGNSSSAAARSFADFLASTAAGSGNGKGFPLFPSPAYGGSWNQQQQQMMMNIMSMNRSGGMMFDDGEVSRSSSHCSGSPTGGLGGSSHHHHHHHHHLTDAKKNHPNDESGERSNSDSPFAFRNMLKYGGSASGGFYPSGGPPSVSSPFLFPFLQSSSAGNSPLANHSMGRGASGGLLGSPSALGGSIRIFNHEAYCELCNKEFCNKYFLKTHKANKHGIYVDNIPPTPTPPTTNGGGVVVTGCSTTSVTPDGRISGPASISTPSSSSNGTGIGSSNGVQSLPFSVSSSFGPPSLSLTVGAMTYPMHPPSTELAPIDPAPPVTYSPIMTTSPSKSIYQTGGLLASASMTTTLSTSATTTIPSLSAITTPTSGMSAPSGGLMDFFPMWPSQTSTPPVTTSNNTLAVPSSLNPISTSAVSMKHNLQHLPGGIVNPEAYCELCQKEFCNKYFLKRHKAKMHGILPPEGSAPTTPSSAGTSLPSSSGGGGGGSSSHKRSKSHSSKQTAPLAIAAAAAAATTAVDLKIPITLPSTAITSPARNLPASGSEAIAEQPATLADPVQESNGTTSTAFNLLMQGGLGSLGIKNETGGCGSGGVLPSSGSKLDLSNSSGGGRQDNNSLSLLKIPTPSLSAMFSTPSPMMESHPARIHHSKTPSSSSSSGGGGGGGANGSSGGGGVGVGGGMVPQQLFSPERLRQMGVINTEAFCEICCKEFCNKYFLRTHKFKKHGIGSMPEQQQQQQQSSSQQSDSSSSSTGMIRQHHYNNNNNNNNKRGGPSPTAKQLAIANSEFSPEQKMPLNLVTTPSGTLTTATTTTTTTMGQQPPQQQQASQLDGGMPLSCDLCQRPFQSTYLLHMHRTYFHNQPPPADESMNENDMNDTSAMDEDNQSDNGQEDDETGTFTNTNSPQPPSIAVKSEPEARNADAAGEDQRPVSTDANNSSSGGITISADLQKLQSMIMELNGSSSSAAAAAAAAASMAGEDRRRCWMDGPVKSSGNNINQLSVGHNESGNHYISASGGGIVKIVNPATSDPSDPGNLASASSSSSMCHLCGNKDFLSPSFLQIHMQNFHGIGVGGSGDPSAAAMEAAVAAAASQLGFDRLLDFGPPPAPSSTSGHHHMKRSSGGGGGGGGGGGRSSSSASPAATRSYCQICNKELCNKYFMKTHMLKMHGIHLEASGGGSQIGGVQCDICHKELCSKYFLKVHKQNTHGIVFPDHEMLLPNGVGGPAGNMLKEQQHQGVMDLSFHQHHHHHQQQQQQQQQQMQQQMMEGSNSPVKSTSVTESCPLCPKRFKSSKALKAHLSHDHSGSSGSSTAACCYICSQQFGDVVALQVHLIKSHASHLMDHHQTPPPPVSVSTSVAAATPMAGGSEQQQANQGCPMSSPSPKTSPSSFQRSSYCDYSAGYLFANERGGQMGESCPPPPPMPGLVPASANASPRPSSAVGTRSPPAAVNQQKIQCPLCGHQLPLEQFQTHLMAHQFPINFLHTLMPPSSSAGTATAPQSHAHEEHEHDELGAINQQQQQQQRNTTTTTTPPTTGRRKRRYRCSVCSRKFATRQLCLTHILQRHPPSMRSSHNSGGSMTNVKSGIGFGLSSPTSPVSTCHMIQSQQRPLTCPRCGYATRQPQLLRLHLRTQQCIPVVARNPDLQQLPPYLAVPTSTASMGGPHAGSPSRLSAIINNKQGLGLQSVQGQHAHRQDFVLQAFLLTQPDAETNKSSSSSNANAKNRRGGDPGANQENGHHNNHDDQVMDPSTVAIKRQSQQNGNRLSGQDSEERKRTTTDQQKDRPADAATKEPRDNGDDEDEEEEEGQNQSCNFIPSLILLPVNRRIANPLSLTFSLTPA